MLIIYLAVLTAALYAVSRVLLPEMAKAPVPVAPKPKVVPESKSFDSAVQPSGPEDRMKKLEILLVEKNKNINLLQTELKLFHIQVRDSDKIKLLLEEEIYRLREQNRIFRSELGLPAIQPAVQAENSII